MSAAAFLSAILIAAAIGGSHHASGQLAPSPSMVPALSPTMTTAGPAAPGTDCMSNLLNMSACLSYVQAGSKEAKPDKACCPELAGLVESSPQCLCYLLGGDTAKQYGIDIGKALKLPTVCGVQTPSPSLCSVFGVPVAAPSANEESGSPVPSISPGAQPPGGLADSPATGIRGNEASRTARSAVEFLIGLSIAVSPIFVFF